MSPTPALDRGRPDGPHRARRESQGGAQRGPLRRALGSVIAWFDSWSVDLDDDRDPYAPDWLRVVPFLVLHASCLLVLVVGWSPVAVGVAVAMYLVRMFAITAFYHRYFSHRAFRVSRPVQFFFALLGASAVQRGPLWWAAHHRHHHRASDQPEDTHSPSEGRFWWSHVGWILCRANYRTRTENVRDLQRYPELVWIDRFDSVVPLLYLAGTFALGGLLRAVAPGLGTGPLQMAVWAFAISTVALYHGTFTINSLAHRFGWRAYDTPDDSRNSFLLALITLGEGWHNNHHHYPAATRQGFRWWQLDLTYLGLLALSRVGLVRDLRPVPQRVLDRARPWGAAARGGER